MSAWGAKPAAAAAWSSQVDEEEQNGEALSDLPPLQPLPLPLGAEPELFPSLGEAAAVAAKETKREKKKKQVLSLADFQKGSTAAAPAANTFSARRAQQAEEDLLKRLPTGPRERAEGEDGKGPGLGGAFKQYGGGRSGGFQRDDDDDRGRGRDRDDEGPSRADAADDWGGTKKFVPGASSRGGFGDRGGFGSARSRSPGSDRSGGGPSRADEAPTWGGGSKYEPSAPRRGGFEDRDRDRDRGGGFRDRDDAGSLGPARADEEDRWSKKFTPGEPAPLRRGPSSSSGAADGEDRWSRSTSSMRDPEPSFASGERPRIKLAPRSLPPPVLKVEPQPEQKQAAATSQPAAEAAPVPSGPPKPKSNPFGAARPREEVLKEQGRDWQKEEFALEHKRVNREDTAEEKELRDKLEQLRERIAGGEADAVVEEQPEPRSSEPAEPEKPAVMTYAQRAAAAAAAEEAANGDANPNKENTGSTAQGASPAQDGKPAKKGKTVQQAADELEAQLIKLVAELDDKVRFSKEQPRGRVAW